MKEKLKGMKGITLIALVITIIVLIILAAISINIVLGENGLVNRAKNAGEEYSKSSAREKLEIALAALVADKNTVKEYDEDEYITAKLEEQGFIVEGDIITVDGWQFVIDRSVPEIVEELGKVSPEKLLYPTILRLNKEVKETEITVNVELKNPVGAKMVYAIREEGATEEKERTGEIEETGHKFTGLTMGVTYEIIVEATNEYGTSTRKVKETTKAPVLVSKITLNKTSTMLGLKNTEQLTYTVEPNDAADKTVIWSSSDEKIAKVDSAGLITPVAGGECEIICTSTDGGASAICKVTIVNGSLIYTREDLEGIALNLSGTYILMDNIDLAGKDWAIIGVSNGSSFKGTLDGNGYSIKNQNKPIFDSLDKATIKNIKFEDVAINQPGMSYGSAIAMKAWHYNKITNVGVTGNIISKGYTAGLVGNVALSGPGYSTPIEISNCYVRANIGNGEPYAGGLVLMSSGTYTTNTSNCYFSGTIKAAGSSSEIGASGSVVNCYYENETHVDGSTIGLTKDEMGVKENFANWDFENTWIMEDGYPELRIFEK